MFVMNNKIHLFFNIFYPILTTSPTIYSVAPPPPPPPILRPVSLLFYIFNMSLLFYPYPPPPPASLSTSRHHSIRLSVNHLSLSNAKSSLFSMFINIQKLSTLLIFSLPDQSFPSIHNGRFYLSKSNWHYMC